MKRPAPAPLRLDLALWNQNLDAHATPAFRFLPQGQVVALARAFRAALGHEASRPGGIHRAASVLLGRRVTSLKRVRAFEYAQLREVLDEQTEDHPAAVYGEGEYL